MEDGEAWHRTAQFVNLTREITRLFHRWDPLDLAHAEDPTEYDIEAGQVARMLLDHDGVPSRNVVADAISRGLEDGPPPPGPLVDEIRRELIEVLEDR